MRASTRQVALVTGGSRRIGFRATKALAASAYDPAVNGRREACAVEPALAELRAADVEAIYGRAKVADLGDHGPMLAASREWFGPSWRCW